MNPPSKGYVLKELLKRMGFWGLVGAIGAAAAAALITFLTGGLALFPILAAALGGGLGGALAGALDAVLEILNRSGVPFNVVRGRRFGISDDGMGFNGQLAYFGRTPSTGFPAYRAAKQASSSASATPSDLAEVIAGLIPVLLNFAPSSAVSGSSRHNQHYQNLSQAVGAVVWALIPLGIDASSVGEPPGVAYTTDDGTLVVPVTAEALENINLVMPGGATPLDGLLMVIGKYSAGFVVTAQRMLASIGARDAVAMDGSDSVMLGSGAELFPINPAGQGSPPWYKQGIQRYGFGSS
jgi:hypothetical protein